MRERRAEAAGGRAALAAPRPILVKTLCAAAIDDHLDRIVALLARGLERLLTGKGIEQDGREVEAGLDFLPHQSVTTDDVLGSSEGCR